MVATKCRSLTKISKISSNFSKICIHTWTTERALVNPEAKGSHPQIFGEGDSREKHRHQFVTEQRPILDEQMSFSYSTAVNKKVIDENCCEIKKGSTDSIVGQIRQH